ncbi:MAG TPA: hypothetical protein VHX38_16700 [Pseudonocardiaceae bacterium]|nr:hypothetical protein [Pseudonocardiaceae bacterium]
MATIPVPAHGPNRDRSERPDTPRAEGLESAESARTQHAAGRLTEQDQTTIRAAVLALPAATDAEIEGLCEVIANARDRWRHTDPNHGSDAA